MKKTFATQIMSVLILILLSSEAMAYGTDAEIAVDSSNFPDANFRSYVAENCDTDQNGFLSDTEISAVGRLEIGYLGVTDLTGIEHFSALTYLECPCNNLTNLDLKANTLLTGLSCWGNQLRELDLCGCTSLVWLDCSENQLTNLDVSACANLRELYCFENQLSSLDLNSNTDLHYLSCAINQLSSLDVSANVNLSSLICEENQLTSLDLRSNTNLLELGCGGNHLTTLDLYSNSHISGYSINMSDQAISFELTKKGGVYFLDFSTIVGAENTDRIAVTSVIPADAQYSMKDGIFTTDSNIVGLTYSYLYPHANDLDYAPTLSVNLINKAKIQAWYEGSIAINNINFPDEDFRRYVAARCDMNHDRFLSPEETASVMSMDINGYRVDNFNGSEFGGRWPARFDDLTGIEFFPALTMLNCSHNELTSLDVHKCTALTILDCSDNNPIDLESGLKSLDVAGCSALSLLNCEQNDLTSLDVSGCTALTLLNCEDNSLSRLDINDCKFLTHLECTGNKLTSLNVGRCIFLTHLNCGYNQLLSLELSSNTMLTDDIYDYRNHYYSTYISDQGAIAGLTNLGGIYRLDFANLVGPENVDRVTVTAVLPADAQYSVHGGVLTTETALTSLTYEYSHGGPNIGAMEVTLDIRHDFGK